MFECCQIQKLSCKLELNVAVRTAYLSTNLLIFIHYFESRMKQLNTLILIFYLYQHHFSWEQSDFEREIMMFSLLVLWFLFDFWLICAVFLSVTFNWFIIVFLLSLLAVFYCLSINTVYYFGKHFHFSTFILALSLQHFHFSTFILALSLEQYHVDSYFVTWVMRDTIQTQSFSNKLFNQYEIW